MRDVPKESRRDERRRLCARSGREHNRTDIGEKFRWKTKTAVSRVAAAVYAVAAPLTKSNSAAAAFSRCSVPIASYVLMSNTPHREWSNYECAITLFSFGFLSLSASEVIVPIE